jgi:hypothetical protein
MTLAWYFAKEDKKLRYGDGRKIVVGKSHLHRGDPVLCESGLHASVNILDALSFAPGPILYRVKLGGRMVACSDKVASTKRTYLSEMDAATLLIDFARKCALDVAHLWAAPDVVRVYLESGREDLRDAARAAARDAAWVAARDPGRAAAWDAQNTRLTEMALSAMGLEEK